MHDKKHAQQTASVFLLKDPILQPTMEAV